MNQEKAQLNIIKKMDIYNDLEISFKNPEVSTLHYALFVKKGQTLTVMCKIV